MPEGAFERIFGKASPQGEEGPALPSDKMALMYDEFVKGKYVEAVPQFHTKEEVEKEYLRRLPKNKFTPMEAHSHWMQSNLLIEQAAFVHDITVTPGIYERLMLGNATVGRTEISADKIKNDYIKTFKEVCAGEGSFATAPTDSTSLVYRPRHSDPNGILPIAQRHKDAVDKGYIQQLQERGLSEEDAKKHLRASRLLLQEAEIKNPDCASPLLYESMMRSEHMLGRSEISTAKVTEAFLKNFREEYKAAYGKEIPTLRKEFIMRMQAEIITGIAEATANEKINTPLNPEHYTIKELKTPYIAEVQKRHGFTAEQAEEHYNATVRLIKKSAAVTHTELSADVELYKSLLFDENHLGRDKLPPTVEDINKYAGNFKEVYATKKQEAHEALIKAEKDTLATQLETRKLIGEKPEHGKSGNQHPVVEQLNQLHLDGEPVRSNEPVKGQSSGASAEKFDALKRDIRGGTQGQMPLHVAATNRKHTNTGELLNGDLDPVENSPSHANRRNAAAKDASSRAPTPWEVVHAFVPAEGPKLVQAFNKDERTVVAYELNVPPEQHERFTTELKKINPGFKAEKQPDGTLHIKPPTAFARLVEYYLDSQGIPGGEEGIENKVKRAIQYEIELTPERREARKAYNLALDGEIIEITAKNNMLALSEYDGYLKTGNIPGTMLADNPRLAATQELLRRLEGVDYKNTDAIIKVVGDFQNRPENVTYDALAGETKYTHQWLSSDAQDRYNRLKSEEAKNAAAQTGISEPPTDIHRPGEPARPASVNSRAGTGQKPPESESQRGTVADGDNVVIRPAGNTVSGPEMGAYEPKSSTALNAGGETTVPESHSGRAASTSETSVMPIVNGQTVVPQPAASETKSLSPEKMQELNERMERLHKWLVNVRDGNVESGNGIARTNVDFEVRETLAMMREHLPNWKSENLTQKNFDPRTVTDPNATIGRLYKEIKDRYTKDSGVKAEGIALKQDARAAVSQTIDGIDGRANVKMFGPSAPKQVVTEISADNSQHSLAAPKTQSVNIVPVSEVDANVLGSENSVISVKNNDPKTGILGSEPRKAPSPSADTASPNRNFGISLVGEDPESVPIYRNRRDLAKDTETEAARILSEGDKPNARGSGAPSVQPYVVGTGAPDVVVSYTREQITTPKPQGTGPFYAKPDAPAHKSLHAQSGGSAVVGGLGALLGAKAWEEAATPTDKAVAGSIAGAGTVTAASSMPLLSKIPGLRATGTFLDKYLLGPTGMLFGGMEAVNGNPVHGAAVAGATLPSTIEGVKGVATAFAEKETAEAVAKAGAKEIAKKTGMGFARAMAGPVGSALLASDALGTWGGAIGDGLLGRITPEVEAEFFKSSTEKGLVKNINEIDAHNRSRIMPGFARSMSARDEVIRASVTDYKQLGELKDMFVTNKEAVKQGAKPVYEQDAAKIQDTLIKEINAAREQAKNLRAEVKKEFGAGDDIFTGEGYLKYADSKWTQMRRGEWNENATEFESRMNSRVQQVKQAEIHLARMEMALKYELGVEDGKYINDPAQKRLTMLARDQRYQKLTQNAPELKEILDGMSAAHAQNGDSKAALRAVEDKIIARTNRQILEMDAREGKERGSAAKTLAETQKNIVQYNLSPEIAAMLFVTPDTLEGRVQSLVYAGKQAPNFKKEWGVSLPGVEKLLNIQPENVTVHVRQDANGKDVAELKIHHTLDVAYLRSQGIEVREGGIVSYDQVKDNIVNAGVQFKAEAALERMKNPGAQKDIFDYNVALGRQDFNPEYLNRKVTVGNSSFTVVESGKVGEASEKKGYLIIEQDGERKRITYRMNGRESMEVLEAAPDKPGAKPYQFNATSVPFGSSLADLVKVVDFKQGGMEWALPKQENTVPAAFTNYQNLSEQEKKGWTWDIVHARQGRWSESGAMDTLNGQPLPPATRRFDKETRKQHAAILAKFEGKDNVKIADVGNCAFGDAKEKCTFVDVVIKQDGQEVTRRIVYKAEEHPEHDHLPTNLRVLAYYDPAQYKSGEAPAQLPAQLQNAQIKVSERDSTIADIVLPVVTREVDAIVNQKSQQQQQQKQAAKGTSILGIKLDPRDLALLKGLTAISSTPDGTAPWTPASQPTPGTRPQGIG